MQVVRTLDELQAGRAAFGSRPVGLVPTMGALHAGHRALVQAAVDSGAAVAASIFVNPLQFAANEDLSRYPRDEAADLAMLEDAGCALVWLPDVATMYPPGNATTVEVAGPALGWEGAQRPGHFRGVATVVARLFGQIRPDLAFFGEKDWQQVQVVTRMVADLVLPVRIVPVPTVRDADGLALSSRNRFLSAEERARAAHLPVVLRTACDRLHTDGLASLAAARQALEDAGFSVDYLELVDSVTLERLTEIRPGSRLLAAARLGSVRLLDNMAVG